MAIYKIFENDVEINRIVANEDFTQKYCQENGYTYLLEELPQEEPAENVSRSAFISELKSSING